MFGFEPRLVLLLDWKACAGILPFRFEVCPPGNENTPLYVLVLSGSVIQFRWINCLLFVCVSVLLCHILFLIILAYFLVSLWPKLCMPLSASRGTLLVCFHDLFFYEVKKTPKHFRLSLWHKSKPFCINEWLLTPFLHLCFAPLLQHNEGVRLLVLFGRLYSANMECTDKPVIRDYLGPAVQPDIAGRPPNLAWNSLWR